MTFEEFRAEHGEFVRQHGHYYFLDGSRASSTDGAWYAMSEPPENEYERLRAVRRYWQCKIDNLTSQFNRLKMSGALPAELRKMREVVRRDRVELAEVEKLLAQTPEAGREQFIAQQQAEQQRRDASLRAEINAITL